MDFKDRAKDTADDVADQAADVADTVADKAHDLADTVADKADDVAGKAKDVADDARSTAEDVADRASDQVKGAARQVRETAADVSDELSEGHGVINRLHRLGVRSEYAYIGGFASIGLSLASWFVSRQKTGDSKAQSDRWGIFIGHWAPTFMALGVALKLEEKKR